MNEPDAWKLLVHISDDLKLQLSKQAVAKFVSQRSASPIGQDVDSTMMTEGPQSCLDSVK